MGPIPLTPFDLALAAVLVVALALLSRRLGLGLERSLAINALRATVQLSLIGLVLKVLFEIAHPALVGLMALVMVGLAGREVMARQKRRLRGWWGYGVGTLSMFLSSFTVALLALTVLIGADPWYAPQYAIPLLGMLLGNTMNGIGIALDRFTQTVWSQRAVIEARLALGQPWSEAVTEIRRESIRSGLIHIINAMAAAGVISLPGMMTGQILAGAAPVEAVKYQLLIMFLITAGTGFGTAAALWAGSKRLFDGRHRLRLDRLN
ncbi:ABC transporter permease [Endothiovibrio diazotrophicus]